MLFNNLHLYCITLEMFCQDLLCYSITFFLICFCVYAIISLRKVRTMKTRIKELRKTLGLTQADFASKINVKRPTIAAYELGNIDIPDRTVADIVRVCGVNEQWLRTGEGDMFPVPANSSGDEFAKYAEQLMASNDEADQWTKEIIVRWCKLPPDRQRLFIHVLHDLFAGSAEQEKLEELFPLV